MSAEQRPPLATPVVQHALRPQIAVFASPDVDELARSNGLNTLAQLLKPWEASVERVALRTSSFLSHTVPVLPLLIDDSRDLVHTDLDALFLDHLTTSIEKKVPQWLDGMEVLDVGEEGDEELWKEGTVEELTPWYSYYRQALVNKRPRTEYETFGHPVACIIAVSTSSPEPLNAFAALYEATSADKLFPNKPWVDPNVLRYYVLVHDLSSGPSEEWSSLLEDVRRAYGVHCGFLALNSEIASLPDSAYTTAAQRPAPKEGDFSDYWKSLPTSPTVPSRSAFSSSANLQQLSESGRAASTEEGSVELGKNLGEEDVRRIKAFLREFTVQSLVPWMERTVSQTNEQLAANRKGIAGRLFSVGRRYFGAKPASPSPGSANGPAYDPIQGIYAYQTQEAQTRRLADFAFMISDFRLAAAMYEIARKDFMNDKAWRYYASATRMAGLTGLLLSTSPGAPAFDADVYLEQATAASPPGMTPLDELRAICMYYELYRATGDWRKASSGLSRTASDIEELPSAIMLEQAAMALLRLQRPARRRFAMLMTIAAHRYQKTGSKALARRCGLQALSIYPKQIYNGWTLSRNHLEHTLGRQAYNLGNSEQAIQHFVRLLSRHDLAMADTEDQAQVDESFLDDFKLAWDLLGERADEVAASLDLKLTDPVFDAQATEIVLDSALSSGGDESLKVLEKQFLQRGYPYKADESEARKAPIALLPDSAIKSVIVGGSFEVALLVRNSLNSPLELQDLRLTFETESASDLVEAETTAHVSVASRTTQTIPFIVKTLATGTCSLKSVTFRFNGLLRCTENLVKHGKRLHTTKAHMQTPTYDQDTSLTVKISPPTPSLKIDEDTLPAQVYAGEVGAATMTLVNAGSRPLKNLRVLCSHPAFICHMSQDPTLYPMRADHPADMLLPNALYQPSPETIKLPNGVLQPNEPWVVHLVYRGDDVGEHNLQWLFVYEDADDSRGTQLSSYASRFLEVIPSLGFQPRIRNDLSPPCISLTIENSSLPEEVEILQISAVSPLWDILSGGGGERMTIATGQTTTMHISARQTNVPGLPTDIWSFTLSQLDLLLSGRDLNSGRPGDVKLRLSEASKASEQIDCTSELLARQITATRTALRLQSLTEQFPTLEEDLLAPIFPLYTPNTIDLLIYWRCKTSGRQGHHYLADLPLGVSGNITEDLLSKAGETAGGRYEESQRDRSLIMDSIGSSELAGNQCPVTVYQQVAPTLDRDTKGNSSVQTCLLQLRNTSSSDVDCVLELLKAGAPGLQRLHRPPNWHGKLIHRRTVKSAESCNITALYLTQEGVYDLGSYVVHIEQAGKKWTLNGQERYQAVQ